MADSKKPFSHSFSSSGWGKWDFTRKRKSYRSRLGFGDFNDPSGPTTSSGTATSSVPTKTGKRSSYYGYDYYGDYGSGYSYGGGSRYLNYSYKFSSSSGDMEKEKQQLEFYKLAYSEAKDLVNILDFPFRVNIYMDRGGKSREYKFADLYSGSGYRDIYVPGKVLSTSKEDREKLTIFSGLAIHEAAHLLFTDIDPLINEFNIDSNQISDINLEEFRRNKRSIVYKFLSKFIKPSTPEFAPAVYLVLKLTGLCEDERVEVALLEQRNGWGEYIEKQKEYLRSSYGLDVRTVKEEKVSIREFILTLMDMIRYPDHLNISIVDKYKDQFEKVQEILSTNLNNTYDSIYRGLQLFKICLFVTAKDGSKMSDLNDIFQQFPEKEEESSDVDGMIAKIFKTLDTTKLEDNLRRAFGSINKVPVTSVPLSGHDTGRDMKIFGGGFSSIEDTDCDCKLLDASRGVITLGTKPDVIFYRPKGNVTNYRKIYGSVSDLTPTLRSFIRNMNKNYDFVIHGQRTGKLDTSKLAEAYQGVPQVYTKTGVVRTAGINVCVVIDESGSMSGTRIERARSAAILLNEAFGKIPGVDLYIYGQSADEANYSYDNSTDLRIYREPGNRLVDRNGYALSEVSARCENRDGVALSEIAKRIRKFTSQPVLMFVLSDGNPSACGYRGRPAVEDTAKRVKEIKADGFYPIQITISNSCTDSHQMFDSVIDLTGELGELPKKLGSVIRKKIAEALQDNQTLVQI